MSGESLLILGDAADPISRLSATSLRDLAELFCDPLLGVGIGRSVYALATDPTRVVKIESTAGSFQNVIEWETWQNLQATPYHQYLAPCHAISPCGIALVQSRVRPLSKDHPTDFRMMSRLRLPEFLTDFKLNNYGVLNGRIVCCDYGSNLLLNHGAFGSKMRKVRWSDRL